MDDLISRQAAIEAVDKYIDKFDCIEVNFLNGLKIAKKILNDLPSAEPERTAKVEVVEKPNVYKCSECGQYFHRTAWGSPVEYCSRCGAKLDWSGNDLIDREQIIQKLKNRRNLFCSNQLSYSILPKDEKARVDEIDNCIADIKNMLPAEPERKTGKWIVINRRPAFLWLRCSECGHGNDTKTNFCPNCGARMELE